MLKDAIDKFKRDKKHRYFILSGEIGLGKTTGALERAVFLRDNYCIREDENVLYISDGNLTSDLEKIIESSGTDNTIFSLINNNTIEVYSKKEFFHKCYKKTPNTMRFSESDIVRGIILEGIGKLRHENKRIDKIILPQHIDFLYEEILYMKEKGVNSLEEYQLLNRKNRGRSLRKNSKAREAIFELFSWYVNYMKELSLIDYIDEFNCIREGYSKQKSKYAHIILDNCEEITLKELEFFRSLLKDVDYSNFIVIKNKKKSIKDPWKDYFKKNKQMKDIDGNKYKVINVKANKVNENKALKEISKETINEIYMEEEVASGLITKQNKFIDSFRYVDLKHNVSHDFAIDTSSYDEVILNPDTTSEVIGLNEISKVPVYNEIAAGQPISINDEIEGEFNIPVYWLKGVQQPFILKIKGDSMINIDIQDGDYVVVNKQTVASHNDIVAVSIDGEATLKRLWLRGGKAVLMPENDKYYPIEIQEDNAYIIGKAVGIIKALN